ncbi:MAG: 23S rRNA (guanosine(2251)-2'-O)-methyltransferase RlmB [Thermodesulfobacteriota bacterium]|nr:23S rRNA (guanosine(2251)-2'-O)-methyltransferase RlmB [Thermodesulfobacteriota bacterium]
MWITGHHPVEEVLSSRSQQLRKVLLSDSLSGKLRGSFAALAEIAGVPCLTCPREEWHRRTGEKEGGGVAVEIAEFRYAELGSWLSSLPARTTAFLLDGITDPHNLGTVLRNARAFGFSGIVIPRDRSCPVTPAVFRASAGAAAHVPVVQVTNLARAVEELQETGFWIYAAVMDGETDVSTFAPPHRTGFVLGGEDTGIRRLVREKCDGTVRIPMEAGIDSLNVGVTSGILAFCARVVRPT